MPQAEAKGDRTLLWDPTILAVRQGVLRVLLAPGAQPKDPEEVSTGACHKVPQALMCCQLQLLASAQELAGRAWPQAASSRHLQWHLCSCLGPSWLYLGFCGLILSPALSA